MHRQFGVDVHAKVADDSYRLDYVPADANCPGTLGYFAKLCSSTEPQHFSFGGIELKALRRTPAADVVNARLNIGHDRTSLGRFTVLKTLHVVWVQVRA
jgi:hypothetical protein